MLIGILEFQVDLNLWVDAEDNRACLADVLELQSVFSWNSGGDLNPDDNLGDASRGLSSHVLLRVHFGAVEAHMVFLRGDARCRDHAGRESCDNEVGGGKAFAAPVVVGWGVGDEFNLARSVCGRATQFADVKCLLGNHVFMESAVRGFSMRRSKEFFSETLRRMRL